MAARKHVVPLFADAAHTGKGVDSSSDPEHAQSRWLIAENAVFPTRTSVAKRSGTVRSAASVDAKRLASFGASPAVFGSSDWAAWSRYVPSLDESSNWLNEPSSLPNVDIGTEPYGAVVGDGLYADVLDGGTWVAVAAYDTYDDADSTRLHVFDKASGATLDAIVLGSSLTAPALARFAVVDGVNWVVYATSSGIYRREISAAGAIDLTPLQIHATVAASTYAYMDVAVQKNYSDAEHSMFVLHDSGAGWHVTRVFNSGTKGTLTLLATAGGTTGAIWPIGTGHLGFAIGYTSGANTLLDGGILINNNAIGVSLVTLDSVTTATRTIESVVGTDRRPSYAAAYTTPSAVLWTVRAVPAGASEPMPTIEQCVLYDSSGTGSKASTTNYRPGARLWTKPAPMGSGASSFAVGVYAQSWDVNTATVDVDDYQQATCFLLNEDGGAIGQALPGAARHAPRFPSSLSDPQASGALVAAAYQSMIHIIGYDTEEIRSLRLVSVDLDAEDSVTAIEHAGALHVSGSVPFRFTGEQVTEAGFLQYPGTIDVVTSGVAGGLIVGGVYRFVMVYEVDDGKGSVYQSAPTPAAATYTPAASGETAPRVYVQNLDITAPYGGSTGRAVVYRTVANGETFYRDTEKDLRSGTLYATCTATDAEIEDNAILYTDGEILENAPPPPHLAACMHQNRMFIALRDEQRTTIRYSRELTATEIPSYHEDLELLVPETGGRIVALASHGGRLWVLKQSAVMVVEGEAAFDNGTGATFSRPWVASDAVGATSPRAVVNTPRGVLFAGSDGMLWAITDSGVSPMGEAVRQVTDDHGPVIAAVSLPAQHAAVFALSGSSAPLLVYDWLQGEWATWTTRTATTDLAVADGVLYRLDSSSYVWRQSASGYGDHDGTADNWQGLRLRSGFVHKTATPDGWQRISEVIASGYKHGSDGFDLKIACAYNGEPSFESKVRDTSAIVGFDPSAAYGAGSSTYEGEGFTMRFQPSARKQGCSSIMVEISDEEGDDGPQQGFTLTSASLLVQPATGTRRSGRERNVKD